MLTGLTQQASDSLELLFGGTFDPVHLGHLAILESLHELAPTYPIRVLPCAIPALKSVPQVSFQQRVEMLKLATSGMPHLVIDEREAQRNEPSFTVITLRELIAEYPQHRWILVMGMDSVQSLTQWHQWPLLAQLCHLLVINRPEYPTDNWQTELQQVGFKPVADFNLLTKSANGLAFCVNMPEKPHSSTKIRQLIANNRELDSMLPQSVIEYVRQFHLYKSEPI